MSHIRAVIFDLDGTLIDSVPDIAAALNRCLANEGRATLSHEGVAKLVGGGARELVAKALGSTTPSADVDRVLMDFLAFYQADPISLTRLYSGVRELLDSLRHSRVSLAICTNKPQSLTHVILDRLDLASYFAVVWGGEPGKPLKPDAACLRTVCEQLGVSPAEALMVGDSHTDIDAALATGCPSIVVAHGYEQRPLDSLGADAVVEGLAEAGLEIARLMGDDRMGARTSKLRRPA
ncbi:MAG: phosphoglycolate phosphatase [Hyphomicrobium sp.]|nr:phosphoglycolate phosphatase [Hyphomicrobium sp.]